MKRDLKINIYAYTDEQRVLCLDLGARISSHYFQYRIIVTWSCIYSTSTKILDCRTQVGGLFVALAFESQVHIVVAPARVVLRVFR